jgi:hypothetical protein
MYKQILVVYLMFIGIMVFGQQKLVINELDCDTPGLDDKEFIELRSSTPNFLMNGYVLVFFNGSSNGGNASYLTLNLNGYSTDINGIFLIGPTTMVPFPQFIIPANIIQNGADAVAIYKADASAFADGTLAHSGSTLEDVLIYGTGDPDATQLLNIFRTFNPTIKQINEGSTNNTNSIQRKGDGSYYAGTPTPRLPNDGSGIILNGIMTTFDKSIYVENDSVTITCATDAMVTEDLILEFTLSNFNFTTSDYNGSTRILIPKGKSSGKTKLYIVDDTYDEGDEELVFIMSMQPPPYFILNNNFKIRIADNDYKVANFGSPTKPTYGKVSGTQSNSYYDKIYGLSGADLKKTLQSIIANPSVVRAQTYADVIDILKEADQNPENSHQIWLVYLEKGRSKLDFQESSDGIGKWNREHTWPRTRGGFNSIEGDDTFNGKNVYWPTNADSTRHANSDAHGLRAADAQENSNRGNRFYGDYIGPAGNVGSFKGDVARSVFYLAVRYSALELVNGFPEGQVGKFGDLATLMTWHKNDPPDDFEMNRNNKIQEWQFNRNPFIDIPDLVDYIWGNKIGQPFLKTSRTISTSYKNLKIYPNPTHSTLTVEGIDEPSHIDIYDLYGHKQWNTQSDRTAQFDIPLAPGIYLLRISDENRSFVEKLIIK